MTDAGDLISMSGTLLAAFGFYYSVVATALEDTLRQSRPDDVDTRRQKRRASRKTLTRAALPLLAAALIVLLILAPAAVSVARTVQWRLPKLTPSQGALVAMAAFWLILAVATATTAGRLLSREWRWR